MKFILMAGMLITLPAICVIVFFFFEGRIAMIPALVSLGINFLPFVVAGILLRNAKDLGGH
ncbi:MAG: hypothetical protein LBG44_04925 [Gemmatimonadota bacterium]|jgi:tellurite resistance protein TehA-like permease|nr:hypothetical protein [Gemmatimonadota bacterium]